MFGLGAAPTADDIHGFLSQYISLGFGPVSPPVSDVASFLKLYSGSDRDAAAQGLVAAGVDASTVSQAMSFLDTSGLLSSHPIWIALSTVSAIASGYHGIKRHRGSIGWGALWFLLGGAMPVFVPLVAVGQGYARPMEAK